jgi:chromosome segregation ATPase
MVNLNRVEEIWNIIRAENSSVCVVDTLSAVIEDQEKRALLEGGFILNDNEGHTTHTVPGQPTAALTSIVGTQNQGFAKLQIPTDISFDSDTEMDKKRASRSSIEGEDLLVETIERIAKIQQKLTDLSAVLKKENNPSFSGVENVGEKVAKLMQRTTGLSVVLSKNKQDLTAQTMEKERLLRRIQQLEIDLRLQLEICQSLQSQNKEFNIKMSQCEELVVQIESDKGELFEKVQSLEEENETLIKEKLELKVELQHTQTVKAEFENQIKKLRDQIKVLESISSYQEEEIQGEKLNAKQIEELKHRLVEAQKQLEEYRSSQEVEREKYMRLERVCTQLRSDLQSETDYGNSIKKELSDLRTKYLEGIETRKQDLGLSALAASKLYTAYKLRETVGGSIRLI